MSTTLNKIWLSVGPFFTVLPVTPSFLVRFLPVKYQIEALDMIYTLVRGGQSNPAFGLVNGSVKPQSNLVNLSQTWSKLSELWEVYPGPRFGGFWV